MVCREPVVVLNGVRVKNVCKKRQILHVVLPNPCLILANSVKS